MLNACYARVFCFYEVQQFTLNVLDYFFISLEAPVIKCKTSLGIETGRISDVAMTSSSILDTSSFPHYARLRNQNGNCAWLPANTADRNSSWVQIDLDNQTNVSAVATQGSCSGDQWTKSYVIMYSRNGVDWKTYGDLGTIKVSAQKGYWQKIRLPNVFTTNFFRCSLLTAIAAVL